MRCPLSLCQRARSMFVSVRLAFVLGSFAFINRARFVTVFSAGFFTHLHLLMLLFAFFVDLWRAEAAFGREMTDKEHDLPLLIIARIIGPSRHARGLDAILDDPLQLAISVVLDFFCREVGDRRRTDGRGLHRAPPSEQAPSRRINSNGGDDGHRGRLRTNRDADCRRYGRPAGW